MSFPSVFVIIPTPTPVFQPCVGVKWCSPRTPKMSPKCSGCIWVAKSPEALCYPPIHAVALIVLPAPGSGICCLAGACCHVQSPSKARPFARTYNMGNIKPGLEGPGGGERLNVGCWILRPHTEPYLFICRKLPDNRKNPTSPKNERNKQTFAKPRCKAGLE